MDAARLSNFAFVPEIFSTTSPKARTSVHDAGAAPVRYGYRLRLQRICSGLPIGPCVRKRDTALRGPGAPRQGGGCDFRN